MIDILIYLIPIILIMFIVNIILYKYNIQSSYKYLINGITLITLSLTINYFNDIIKGILNLKYLSTKFYLIILLIINIITLSTIKKKYDLIYRKLNYLLFDIISIILLVILTITLGINLNIINTEYSSYNIILINSSIIIFIIYLILISLIYIFKHKKKKIVKEEKTISLEELLLIKDKDNFIINGVECSIIFEDSIPDNIVKNYQILSNNINEKLVNGYTLEENKLLKSICTKLETTNIDKIDLNNLSILNKITAEEYTFLKRINEE